MSCRDNGARWFAGNSLKFRVGSVFINGKITISLTFMDTQWYLWNMFNRHGTWCSSKECIGIMGMHHAKDVVMAQEDPLVIGDVVFESTETLAFCRVFIELLEDDLLLFFFCEAR